MINNEVVSRIAQKIRSTRLKKNLTIQELADRTKVTKGLLSKIENSRTIPSLPVFVQLIQSLDISLKEFDASAPHLPINESPNKVVMLVINFITPKF